MSSRISPTALCTGYVWSRSGASHPELSTLEGRLMFDSLRSALTVSRLLEAPSLERYLLARHRAIDVLLSWAVERDGVRQVIELACGLSPRGWRFAQRYGDRITYVEADLPVMARAHARRSSGSDRLAHVSPWRS